MNRSSDSLAEEFRGAHFDDVRRDRRFRSMLRSLERRRAGKVSEVFSRAADRQGAYDFLEHEAAPASAVQDAAAAAVAKRCSRFDFVYVVLDGSSLTLTERVEASKGFGSIGSHNNGARGIKVLNALALSPLGQTLGVIAPRFWVRNKLAKEEYRPEQLESYRWHEAFEASRESLSKNAPMTKMHVLADREGDASLLMQRIVSEGHDFTIRAKGHRNVLVGGQEVNVRSQLRKLKPAARCVVSITPQRNRSARQAVLAVRAARIQIILKDRHTRKRRVVDLSVVWGREEVATSSSERLDWLLYTTAPVRSASDAVATLKRYCYRWRIEEFHRTLKSGGGCIEDTQLRSVQAVVKWATLHAIVAARAQRLRDASRTTPDLPAGVELTTEEIEALVLLKEEEKRRGEVISANGLSLQTAVRWIADLGGFTATGKSPAPPGTTVINRGLERVLQAQRLIHSLRLLGKMR
jgi:hypothetical protein